MLKLIAIDPGKIAEIRNALTIITGSAHILLFASRFEYKKDTMEKIIEQVNKIDKLLPQYEKGE